MDGSYFCNPRHTELFISVRSVVRISWPSYQCLCRLHPQTATLCLQLDHLFRLRRYPIAASECVKVLQVCVCVILTESIRIQSCLTPLVTLNISCSASSGVTVRSAVSLLVCPSLSPQELCTSQSSSSALTGQRPHLRLCRFVQVCLHTLIPTRSLARDRESNIFTSASRACHCHVNGRVPLPVNNTVQMEDSQMSVACTRINDETPSPSLIGNEKETNVFNSGFNKPDGASLDKITDESHVVTPAVLENRINVTTGRSQLGFHTHPGQERAELLCNDTRLGAFVII